MHGASELQILEYADNTLHDPIPLPGMVAGELSMSAGGSMLAVTVEGPAKPPTVELVDPRTREWESVDREPSVGPLSADPTLESVTARDGLQFSGWLYQPPPRPTGTTVAAASCPRSDRATSVGARTQ
jgi:dipeptidyl aminopeptidase/acylaminoacyl peptidase